MTEAVRVPVTELVLVDFAQLYRSPEPPEPDPMWYFHAYNLSGWRPPGYDDRWNLSVLLTIRRAALRSDTEVVLVSDRPDHREMREVVKEMVDSTEVRWSEVKLRPVLYDGTAIEHRVKVVSDCLRSKPSVRRVIVIDASTEAIMVVKQVVEASGRKFIEG